MEYLIFFILGALIALVITRSPIKIEVHHKHENVLPPLDNVDIRKLEEEMLKDDPKMDELYKEIDKLNDIMGGSDR